MKVRYDEDALWTVIEDAERAKWLDGGKLYYELNKDYRPDFNPYDLEDVHQAFYKLNNLTGRKTSKRVDEALDTFEQLCKIHVDYAKHILGMIIEDDYSIESKTFKEKHE